MQQTTKNKTAFRYEYYLKDHVSASLNNHLGNVRFLFTDTDTDGVPEILQEDAYDPWGVRLAGLSYTQGEKNGFLYNGKEQVKGLGWYDYGFRWYNQEVGRFIGVDPLGEEFAYLSSYQYAGNTPVQAVDLDGLENLHFMYQFNWVEGPDRSVTTFEGQHSVVNYGTTNMPNGRNGVSVTIYSNGEQIQDYTINTFLPAAGLNVSQNDERWEGCGRFGWSDVKGARDGFVFYSQGGHAQERRNASSYNNVQFIDAEPILMAFDAAKNASESNLSGKRAAGIIEEIFEGGVYSDDLNGIWKNFSDLVYQTKDLKDSESATKPIISVLQNYQTDKDNSYNLYQCQSCQRWKNGNGHTISRDSNIINNQDYKKTPLSKDEYHK